MPKLVKYPLQDVIEAITLENCVQLINEAQSYEAMAMRFMDEWTHMPRRQRTPAGVARMIAESKMDVAYFKRFLVTIYENQRRVMARIKSADGIAAITEVSVAQAQVADHKNFDERRAHLERADILDTVKPTVIETNVGIAVQNQMPSFESSVMELEEKMRGQLSAATTDFIEGELVNEKEKELVTR